MISIGIDIGGTSIKAVLLASGREMWRGQSACYSRPARHEVASRLREVLSTVPPGIEHATAGVRVGLCVPGVVDPATGAIVQSANMPGLVGAPLAALLAEAWQGGASVATVATGSGPTVRSDAHAATHDVAIARGLRGRVMGVSLGTGVGAAVLDDGVLLRVSGASSGHMGQWDVTVAGIEPTPVGPDGGVGGLEGYIGVPALVARHGDVGAWLSKLRGDEPEVSALVRAIRIAHALYRPDHVVLLGGVGTRLAPVLAAVRGGVSRGLTSLARPGWTLACGEDDHHAARGIARIAAGE